MVKGQFNQQQNHHIESFFPEFVKQMDKGVTSLALTRWKQTNASNILESALFESLDLDKFSRKTWFEVRPLIARDVKQLTNRLYSR
jgi:hypothetical protein